VNLYVTEYIKVADANGSGTLAVVGIVGATVSVSSAKILGAAHAVHPALFVLGLSLSSN
jgi:hypothetical protein